VKSPYSNPGEWQTVQLGPRTVLSKLANVTDGAAVPELDEEDEDEEEVVVEPPLQWISPNIIAADGLMPPRGRFVLRTAEFGPPARLETRQDGRLLARSRPVRLIPGRPVYLRASWLARVDHGGGPVRVHVGRAG